MRRVRLTEGQLHNVIRESVNNILNEISRDLKSNCMAKASYLGRNSQSYNFANNLCDDLNSQYAYSNKRGDNYFEPSDNGIRLHNRTYMDSDRRNSDWYVDSDDDLADSSETYSPSYQELKQRHPQYYEDEGQYKAQQLRDSRDNIPSYRNAKQELHRLGNIDWK